MFGAWCQQAKDLPMGHEAQGGHAQGHLLFLPATLQDQARQTLNPEP